jgi:hypothetical protein
VRTSLSHTYSCASGIVFLCFVGFTFRGLFHFCELKAVECGKEDQITATVRESDINEELSNLYEIIV